MPEEFPLFKLLVHVIISVVATGFFATSVATGTVTNEIITL